MKTLQLKSIFSIIILLLQTTGVNAQCDEFYSLASVSNGIDCNGGSDGVLTVEVFNGQAPYQYLWSNGAQTQEISDMSAGVYSVNVIDANNCISTDLVLLSEPNAFDFTVVSAPSGCNATYGALSVSAVGGSGSLEFSLDGENWQDGSFSVLEPGFYTIYVIDELGCEGVTYATVSLVGISTNASQVSSNNCFNDCDATIQANADFGLPPYTFNWFMVDADGSPEAINQFTDTSSDLCSGFYFAEVTDESGIGSQEDFWTEDFGFGCNTGQLANGFSGSNGIWTTSATGTNDAFANTFFISAAEQIDAGNCGIGCGDANSRTLHLGNVAALGILTADGGATYNGGGLCGLGICVVTNLRADSPTINCSGRTNIELEFDYIEVGQGTIDNATVWYYDGSSWSLLMDLPKTLCCGGPCNGSFQGSFTNLNIALPASANNNPNVKIGFNWVNNDDGVGTDPSFAVDNITLSSASGGQGNCPVLTPVVYIEEPNAIQLFTLKFSEISCADASDGAIEVFAFGGAPPYNYMWSNGVPFSANLDLGPGDYTITVTDQNDCEIEQTYTIAPAPSPETVEFDFIAMDLSVDFQNNSSLGNYLWDFGDGNTSVELEPSHTYESAGVYEVCLTLISPCGDQTTCQEIGIVTTGIEYFNNQIAVFPNPFVSELILNFNISGIYNLEIYTSEGKMFESHIVQANQFVLKTENWSSGLYFIRAINKNTGNSFTSKVVKTIR